MATTIAMGVLLPMVEIMAMMMAMFWWWSYYY